MRLFGKNPSFAKASEDDDGEYEPVKKIRKVKKETPPKPWGKKERFIVLFVLLTTVFGSAALALSAREYKLPGLPRLTFPKFTFTNPFKEEIIQIGLRKELEIEKKIAQSFTEMTRDLTGLYAFYVIDLNTDEEFGVNEDEIMQAASLIKLPVMLYSQGKVSDDKILAMGKKSDNAVFNEIVFKFGKTTLQKYIDTLEMPDTSLAENETTPKDVGNLLKKIYLSAQAGEDGSNQILSAITDTIFEDWLVKGIPDDIKVAHKYGRETHVINDAGIVFSDKPYILVLMTQGIVDEEANNIIPQISKMVYDEMTK